MRKEVNIADYIEEAYRKARNGGVLISTTGLDGKPNLMTVSWWLFGPFYHDNDVSVIAVKPTRYTYKLLEELGEYVVVVPADNMAAAVAFCGEKSGRDYDKFAETGLVAVPSFNVRPPSVTGALVNIECRVYHKECPPHWILTPEHREAPLNEQHTIYFAEVVGTYTG